MIVLQVRHFALLAEYPNDIPLDIPSTREQLEEQERVMERYEGDFYEPVTVVRS
jgi:hypothetical protein